MYVLLLARLKISEEVQPFAALQAIDLSVAPLRVIPPPTADTSVGLAVSPRVILMSSTETVVALIVVVVPLTIKLPLIVKSLLIVVVPEPAPMLTVVAAPNALTVVAVVFNNAKLVLGVVNDVVIAGLVPNTNTPVPVSSLITPANSAEVVEACTDNLLAV